MAETYSEDGDAILQVPELKERFMAQYKEILKTSSCSSREEMPMVVSEIERGQTVVDAVLEFFASHEKVSSRCEQEAALQSLLSILKLGDVRVLDDLKKLDSSATILEQSADTEQVVEMLDFLATHCTLFSPKDQGTPERPTRASRALEASFSREEVAKDGISSQGAEPGKAYPSPRSFASNGAAAKDAGADQDAIQTIQDTEGKTAEDLPVSRVANTVEVDKGEADGQGSHGVKDARTSAMVAETDAVGVSAENAKGGSVTASAALFVPEGDISAAQMELGAAREVPPGGAYPALATVVKKAARTADSINECVTEIQIKKRRLIDSAQRMRDLEDGRRRAEEALQRELEAEAQERAAVTVAAENLEKAENELRAARIRLQNGDRQRAICRSVAEDAREQSRQAKLAVKVEKADLSALMDRLPK